MLELAAACDRNAVNVLAGQVHALHVMWRPDIYEMVDELFSARRFSEAIENREVFVAKADGCVVGYVLLKIRDYGWPGVVKRKVMVLDEICVDEPFRGQGIGMQMMADIRALAVAFGCTDMQLGVYPQNESAVAFYRKCGFTIRNISLDRKV